MANCHRINVSRDVDLMATKQAPNLRFHFDSRHKIQTYELAKEKFE